MEVPSPLIAAMGRIRSPILFLFFKPPHLPRNKAAFGSIALSRSITVAAVGLPIPKLIMVISSAVAHCIGLPSPITGTLFHSAKLIHVITEIGQQDILTEIF